MYSMRSVFKALHGHLRTVHLIVYDYAFDVARDTPLLQENQKVHGAMRVAQTPTWLDFSRLNASADDTTGRQNTRPSFRYAVHSEIFHLPTGPTDAVSEGQESVEEQWRAKALPSFNSMSIESRMAWLPALAETSVALNDDFFMLRPHSVSGEYMLTADGRSQTSIPRSTEMCITLMTE